MLWSSRSPIEPGYRRHWLSAPRVSDLIGATQGGAVLSHSMFFNRQALHLRPDPARVIVRPFKPATEPRDFNAVDKTRANHIVDRVLSTR